VSALPAHKGRRIPADLKEDLALYARSASAEGTGAGEIARRLGVSAPTVRRLLRSAPRGALLAVGTVELASPPLRVMVPGGLVVEGLDVDGVAALSRALTS